MGNQYSITVSDKANSKFQKMKDMNLKTSKIISDVFEHLDIDTIIVIHARARNKRRQNAQIMQTELKLNKVINALEQGGVKKRDLHTMVVEALDALPIV